MGCGHKHREKSAACRMEERQDEAVKQLVLPSRKASARTVEVPPEQVKQVVLHEEKQYDVDEINIIASKSL